MQTAIPGRYGGISIPAEINRFKGSLVGFTGSEVEGGYVVFVGIVQHCRGLRRVCSKGP